MTSTKLRNIYRITQISSTQQAKIQNVWHLSRNYQLYVFYCYIFNDHKLNLNQYPFIISQFCGSESAWAALHFLLKISQGRNHCLPDKALIWKLWRKICFQAHSGCCRIQFLVSIGLGKLFSCWLTAREHFQVLVATCITPHVAPSFVGQQWHIKFFSWFRFLWFPLCHQCLKILCF